jgi:serine protease Do
VVGRDPRTDLAVLRVTPPAPLKAARFGDSERMRVGQWVMAIGNPFGFGGSVTAGIVSARNRDINSGPYDNFIQTDAAINRGNSGGPLFNMDGEVIGINTAIISPSGGSIGIGFAIPSNLAQGVIAQLREFGETRRGWLGVRIQGVTDEIAQSLGLPRARGAMIAGVTADGPAARGGIQVGDVIVRFNGREVAESRDLPRIVADTAVNQDVPVTVFRRGAETEVRVTVGRLEENDTRQATRGQPNQPQQPQRPAPAAVVVSGMALSGVTAELRRQYRLGEDVRGVVVTRVEPGSPAAERRVAAGEVIVEVNQQAVTSPADVQRQVEALRGQGRRTALFLIANPQGEQRFVAIAIPPQ